MKEELLKYIEESKDFVLSQAPDVFSQIVGLKILVCIFGFIFSIIAFIVLTKVIMNLFKKRCKIDSDFIREGFSKLPIGLIIAWIIVSISLFAIACDIIAWIYFPKAMLLNNLIK